MNVFLTVLGVLLLVPSVAGILFGVFMALDPKTRGAGVFFGVWWVCAVAAAVGVLIGDPATFVMGVLCFLVAGLALVLDERKPQKPAAGRRAPSVDSERTTRQNKIRDHSEDESKGA